MNLNCNEIVAEERRLEDLLKGVHGLEELGFGFASKRLFVRIAGDWKHDHLLCQELLEDEGYELVSKSIEDEDGSDWYTAEYVFKKAE